MNEWEIHERIKILESGFEKFTISGAPGRDVQGSFATGFAVNFVKKSSVIAPTSASYNCNDDGECVDPGDGSGEFTSLDDCNAACGCPPDGAPTHVSVSLDYDISTFSCGDGGSVYVDSSVSFTDIEGDLAPWTADTGPLGYEGDGLCYSALLSDDDLLTQSGCPLEDCDTSDVDAIWNVFLYFDGTDYWIFATVYNDGSTPNGICEDTAPYGLPESPDSPFTNIGPSPIGTHVITYASAFTTPGATATFTIVIS